MRCIRLQLLCWCALSLSLPFIQCVLAPGRTWRRANIHIPTGLEGFHQGAELRVSTRFSLSSTIQISITSIIPRRSKQLGTVWGSKDRRLSFRLAFAPLAIGPGLNGAYQLRRLQHLFELPLSFRKFYSSSSTTWLQCSRDLSLRLLDIRQISFFPAGTERALTFPSRTLPS